MRNRYPKKPSNGPASNLATPSPSAEIVLGALSKVIDPELGRDLVTLGMG